MTIKNRLAKLEKELSNNSKEPVIIGWQDADFYPLTAEELQENRDTGKFIFFRGEFPKCPKPK